MKQTALALKRRPNDPTALLERSYAAMMLGQAGEAERCCGRVLRIDPTNQDIAWP